MAELFPCENETSLIQGVSTLNQRVVKECSKGQFFFLSKKAISWSSRSPSLKPYFSLIRMLLTF